jgi:hypothetical protein
MVSKSRARSSARREDSADTRYVQIGALAGPEAAVPSAAGTVSCWSKGRLPVSLVGILTVYGEHRVGPGPGPGPGVAGE